MKRTRWFTVTFIVQYRDVDSAGHVNNAVYLHYLEDARMKFLKVIYGKYDIEDLDFVVAALRINYHSPAMFGEELQVQIHPTKIGNSSWSFDFKIYERRTKRPICDGESVQVLYDYKRAKKSAIREPFRRKLSEWIRHA